MWPETIIEFEEDGKVIRIGGEPWPFKVDAVKRVEPRKIVRRYTFNALAAVAAFQAASLLWGFLPPGWVQWLTLAIALAGAFGAFIDQPDTR